MSTPSQELISIAHVAFVYNEPALKELVTIFNRIAVQGLSMVLRPEAAHFVTPEFAKYRSMLVDLGILYEPDMGAWNPSDGDTRNSILSLFGDVNEILRPFGTSVEEMLAARNNKEEFQKIRERTKLSNEDLAARITAPERLLQTERRLTVNTTRMFAIQVRNANNPDAYATIPSGDSSLDEDDQRPNKHDVLKIAVAVALPEEQASWQQIIEYRNDPDSQGRFLELKEWMSDIARGAIAAAEAKEKLEFLLNQCRLALQRHEIPINWTKLEAFVVTSADYSESLIRFQKGPSASPLFWVEPRRLALLEAESTLPGSIVAFVTQAKSMFSS